VSFAQQTVNKCSVNGRTVYQSTPCPAGAAQKKVDTTDKNKALGKDMAANAKRDREILEAREAERKKAAARAKAEEAGLSGPAVTGEPRVRNLALERIEKAAEGLKKK
jgi:hypothetical protein